MMNYWSANAQTYFPREWEFIIEFLVKEVNIIEENDTMWDVVGYFDVDHELA
jgi:hypothetical protein